MSGETRVDAHDVMMNLTEACVLMVQLPDDRRSEPAAQMALLILLADEQFKDSLIFAFATQQAALVCALADLRGETHDEAVAHWRLSIMSKLHKTA